MKEYEITLGFGKYFLIERIDGGKPTVKGIFDTERAAQHAFTKAVVAENERIIAEIEEKHARLKKQVDELKTLNSLFGKGWKDRL